MGPLDYTNYSDYVQFYNYIIIVEVPGTSWHYRGLTADFYRPVGACCCFFDACCALLSNPKFSPTGCRLSLIRTQDEDASILNPTFEF